MIDLLGNIFKNNYPFITTWEVGTENVAHNKEAHVDFIKEIVSLKYADRDKITIDNLIYSLNKLQNIK